MKPSKKAFFALSLLALILVVSAMFLAPLLAANNDDPEYTIYLRPGVRWSTSGRTLYIFDLLLPVYLGDRNVVFFNPKFTPNNKDGWEWNLGLGYRHIVIDERLLLGLNAFYDYRKTDWGTRHKQWGVGAEAMGEIPLGALDLGVTGRFNFYYPISEAKIERISQDGGGSGGGFIFQQNGIYGMGGGEELLRIEEPMRGFDYEVGVRIPFVSEYVETWAYAGGYHFHGSHVDDINGFRTRVEALPTDFTRISGEYTHDNANGSEFYGEVAFEIPFSIGNLIAGKNPFEGLGDVLQGSRKLRKRLVEPVRRDVDVMVKVEEKIVESKDGGGPTGLVEEVVFVSEDGSDVTGDGTFENPYRTVAAAMGDARIVSGQCTTIHVINSSAANTAGGGTVNRNNILVWGSGVNHPQYPNISNMTAGYPTVDSTLTLNADDLRAMGMLFDFAGNPGIVINGGTGITVNNNNFDNAGMANALRIFGGNNISVLSNTVLNSDGGINLSPGLGGTNYLISSNNFNTTNMGILINSGAGVNITGNTITVTGNDITGILGSGDSTAANPLLITGNTINVTGTSNTWGMRINAPTVGPLHTSITGNTVTSTNTSNMAVGIGLLGDGSDIGSAGNGITVSGNTVDVNGTGGGSAVGIYLYGNSGGSIYADGSITGNTVDVDGTGWTVGIYSQSDGDSFIDIIGNDLTGGITATGAGADAYGIRSFTTTGGPANDYGSLLNPNTISGNSIVVAAADEARGIDVGSDDETFVVITNNIMSGGVTGGTGETSGIKVFSYHDINATITGNTIDADSPAATGGNVRGIELGTYNGPAGVIEGTISSNTMTGGIYAENGEAFGIYLYSRNNGDIGTATLGSLDIQNNTMFIEGGATNARIHGIWLETSGNIFARGSITGNTIGAYNANGEVKGIWLNAMGPAGTSDILADIANNTLNATMNDHTGTPRTGISTLSGEAYGIELFSNNSHIGYNAATETPVNVTGNLLNVTSADNNAYGIWAESQGHIFGNFSTNNMAVAGSSVTNGIHLGARTGGIPGDLGSTTNPIVMAGNTINVTDATGEAAGMDFYGDNVYFGNAGNPITGNTITVTNSGNRSYGIRGSATFLDLFGYISTNNITATGPESYGILLNTTAIALGNDIGSPANNLFITGNTLTVTANGSAASSDAVGVYLDADDFIFATITGNDMSGGITGYDDAFGIRLSTNNSSIGSAGNRVTISNNPMAITANQDEAHGIHLWSNNSNIFADINNNSSMNVTSTGGLARGAYLHASGLIGSAATTTLFQNNSGTINGSTNRHMLYLDTNSPGAGNNVSWGTGGTANSFTPLNGGAAANWTGNYDVGDGLPAPGGPNKPVQTNFNVGDTLAP